MNTLAKIANSRFEERVHQIPRFTSLSFDDQLIWKLLYEIAFIDGVWSAVNITDRNN